MPRYGWFKLDSKVANVEYDGDYMKMEKEFVQIFRGTKIHSQRIILLRLLTRPIFCTKWNVSVTPC
jgi:hypothetical protein